MDPFDLVPSIILLKVLRDLVCVGEQKKPNLHQKSDPFFYSRCRKQRYLALTSLLFDYFFSATLTQHHRATFPFRTETHFPGEAAATETTISVSIPSALSDSFSWPWRVSQEMLTLPSFVSLDHWSSGNFPLFFSRDSPIPSGTNLEKDASGEDGDNPNCCTRCFGRDTIANAAARVGPAVVNLSVPQGINGLTLGNSVGSGTIIDSDGTILTCAHVVGDFEGMCASSKGRVDVTLQDGWTFEGTVVNADLHSDIAIVKITSKMPLPTAKLGNSSKIRPGDWVLAMGCPFFLQNTVTAGIVSCVDRTSSDLGLGGMWREYIQADCAINSGNSGGPLVNIDGEGVGVNTMQFVGADGLSFYVPIDSVSKIIKHFKKRGRVVRPWLGLEMLDLNSMIITQLKERDATFPDVSRGVLVPRVIPGSPADCAGFRPGDVILEFDGKPVGSVKEINELMGDEVGKPLKVVVNRAKDGFVTLTVTPKEANPKISLKDFSCSYCWIGLAIFELQFRSQ